MRIKKRILLPIIFIAALASGIIIIEKTVDIGGLMISLLERAAHITIDYRGISKCDRESTHLRTEIANFPNSANSKKQWGHTQRRYRVAE